MVKHSKPTFQRSARTRSQRRSEVKKAKAEQPLHEENIFHNENIPASETNPSIISSAEHLREDTTYDTIPPRVMSNIDIDCTSGQQDGENLQPSSKLDLPETDGSGLHLATEIADREGVVCVGNPDFILAGEQLEEQTPQPEIKAIPKVAPTSSSLAGMLTCPNDLAVDEAIFEVSSHKLTPGMPSDTTTSGEYKYHGQAWAKDMPTSRIEKEELDRGHEVVDYKRVVSFNPYLVPNQFGDGKFETAPAHKAGLEEHHPITDFKSSTVNPYIKEAFEASEAFEAMHECICEHRYGGIEPPSACLSVATRDIEGLFSTATSGPFPGGPPPNGQDGPWPSEADCKLLMQRLEMLPLEIQYCLGVAKRPSADSDDASSPLGASMPKDVPYKICHNVASSGKFFRNIQFTREQVLKKRVDTKAKENVVKEDPRHGNESNSGVLEGTTMHSPGQTMYPESVHRTVVANQVREVVHGSILADTTPTPGALIPPPQPSPYLMYDGEEPLTDQAHKLITDFPPLIIIYAPSTGYLLEDCVQDLLNSFVFVSKRRGKKVSFVLPDVAYTEDSVRNGLPSQESHISTFQGVKAGNTNRPAPEKKMKMVIELPKSGVPINRLVGAEEDFDVSPIQDESKSPSSPSPVSEKPQEDSVQSNIGAAVSNLLRQPDVSSLLPQLRAGEPKFIPGDGAEKEDIFNDPTGCQTNEVTSIPNTSTLPRIKGNENSEDDRETTNPHQTSPIRQNSSAPIPPLVPPRQRKREKIKILVNKVLGKSDKMQKSFKTDKKTTTEKLKYSLKEPQRESWYASIKTEEDVESESRTGQISTSAEKWNTAPPSCNNSISTAHRGPLDDIKIPNGSFNTEHSSQNVVSGSAVSGEDKKDASSEDLLKPSQSLPEGGEDLFKQKDAGGRDLWEMKMGGVQRSASVFERWRPRFTPKPTRSSLRC